MFADIILPLNLPQALTYGVPVELQEQIRPGMRVEVALGKNKQYAGIVVRLHNHKPDAYIVKPVKGIIDTYPVVTDHQLAFWHWVSQYYMCSPGEVMQAALPAHLKLMGETRLQWIAQDMGEIQWSANTWPVVDALVLKQEITITELRALAGAKHFASVLNELLENGAVAVNDALEATYKPKKEKIVSLNEQYVSESGLMQLFDQLQRAPRQLQVIMAYTELNTKTSLVKYEDLLKRADASAAQLKALTDKGIFTITEIIADRVPARTVSEPKEIALTQPQQQAYADLSKGLNEKSVVLLQGVTGSGKTLLYINKIRECIATGRQALFLLPEIALTTQLVSRLQSYFGAQLGVYHSHFSNNERIEIWEKVRKGTYQVVLGPRSALWLPYPALGLIIVDEEHDASYKQRDPAPRFHARDAAIFLASVYGARTILGSATPSLESLYNVQQGKYGYAGLKDRYLGVSMPQIELVNARSLETVKAEGIKMITPELQQAIAQAIKNHRQVILFQNRRGYAPFQLCLSCGWVPQCKNCSVSLTYHKSTDKLHCHYCGVKSAVVDACAWCGSNSLVSKSYGTEKIEEEIQMIFPKARVARMDVDSMRSKNSITDLMQKLEQQKIDILVGTQMVVKGLDFASVSLVGILSADSLLSFPDFRVNERAFQLMEQVSGRAGRADGKGRVLIQAYNMQHPALKWVVAHDVAAFYRHEIKYREHFSYPPFARLIKVLFKHENEAKAANAAVAMASGLHSIPGIQVQGPAPAIISRVRNLYIHEIWLKCPRDYKVLDSIKLYLRDQRQYLAGQKGNSGVQIVFDVDPA